MPRVPFAFIVAAAFVAAGMPAVAQSPPPKTHASETTVKSAHGRSLGNNIRLHGRSSDSKVSAAACSQRAAGMPGSVGTLGPNGASSSQTLVTVPIGGGTAATAAATRQQQINEACAHVRR